MTTVWDPIKIGNLSLPHRFAMAPMTRSRANPDGTPGPFAAEYYAQRASLGLLITEGVQPSEDGQGYLTTPGIHNDAQVKGWRKVTSAIHDAGGRIFIQLMHVGRMSHPDNTPHHRQPVAPSALATGEQMYTANGMQPMPTPRALTTAEVKATVQDIRRAAALAIEAGADGVELHGANGYLLHQFFAANANLRTDEYGGSYQNRARLAIEVVQAVAQEIGPERTSLRISPLEPVGGLKEGDENLDLYRYLTSELDKLKLAYLHVYYTPKSDALLNDIRNAWSGPLMLLRSPRTLETVGNDVESGLADIVSIGKWALANPDFIERFRHKAPFNEPIAATFYGGTNVGYTDYPTMAAR
ncbi:alkene reductase [Paraburkholderia humisilvae]|uniref:N-ethylmaleimide reductase n=1 Tax=Paraburkholderia humisilvae TaxID=627669 RepID=A0A6J5ENP3_9BURK|nr:alkene reductase [Paraburkholderia humisilvae]CAB3768160.1 N-ethylmaleimide reductase [Paraburkholderia humisilvae]